MAGSPVGLGVGRRILEHQANKENEENCRAPACVPLPGKELQRSFGELNIETNGLENK